MLPPVSKPLISLPLLRDPCWSSCLHCAQVLTSQLEYDVDTGTKQALATGVQISSRRYASSFTSSVKRFPPLKMQHDLAPGNSQ